MCWRCRLSLRRVLLFAFYFTVLIVQLLFLWPSCENLDSSSVGTQDLEQEEARIELGPLPSNLLDPPMWEHHYSGSCGAWQKPYTHMHRAMLSGNLPPSYLVYTTGRGFPPNIQGVPEAMKGIATVFMLALLTERAFVLDWRSPMGFERILVPRYIDWRHEVIFRDDPDSIVHVHDIGSRNWFQKQNKSVNFYIETDFNTYFSEEKVVIQAHSFDFTYALLRNKHFRKKIKELGLHTVRCKVCCIWNYLFRQSTSFVRNSATVARKKLGLTPQNDLIFVDLSFPLDSVPQSLLNQQMERVFDCVNKVAQVLHNPVCVVASNNYYVLTRVSSIHPSAKTNNGLFFTRIRYQSELNHQFNTTSGRGLSSKFSTHEIMLPRTEHNALMYLFMSYYLQLNSTVLFTSRKSPFSESMAAFRHYYHPTQTYITRPDIRCKMERYR